MSKNLAKSIRVLRRFIGKVRHHPNCDFQNFADAKCDCYAKRHVQASKALDDIVKELEPDHAE